MIRFNSRTVSWSWLSNMHVCPVVIAGYEYGSVEEAYQALKAEARNLPKVANKIRRAHNPWDARKLGKGIDLPKPEKLVLIKPILAAKFVDGLGEQLVWTHPRTLIHEVWWPDTFWGVYQGVGQNKLGQLLMNLRADLITKGVGR